jgi:hypothetical protein
MASQTPEELNGVLVALNDTYKAFGEVCGDDTSRGVDNQSVSGTSQSYTMRHHAWKRQLASEGRQQPGPCLSEGSVSVQDPNPVNL